MKTPQERAKQFIQDNAQPVTTLRVLSVERHVHVIRIPSKDPAEPVHQFGGQYQLLVSALDADDNPISFSIDEATYERSFRRYFPQA